MSASIFSHCSKLLPLIHKFPMVCSCQLQAVLFTCASFDSFPYKIFAAHIGYTSGWISVEAWGTPHFMSESYSHSIVMKPNSYPLIFGGMRTKIKSLVWTKWGKFQGKEKSTFPLPWFLICPQLLPPLLLWGGQERGRPTEIFSCWVLSKSQVWTTLLLLLEPEAIKPRVPKCGKDNKSFYLWDKLLIIKMCLPRHQ